MMNWKSLTDDEVLDAWRNATEKHKAAKGKDLDKYFLLRSQAEHEAATRFGQGEHLAAYKARFPDDAE